MMGGIEVVGYRPAFTLMPIAIICGAGLVALTRELNLISFGETIALSRGVDTKKLKTILFFTVSFLVGTVVSVAGPIGFVGMMCPHICRMLVGYNHRHLMPTSFFFGGMFLVICDTIARMAIAPAEIPVGVITALLGGPFFLWLLLQKREELM